jgi:hypothetical protein
LPEPLRISNHIHASGASGASMHPAGSCSQMIPVVFKPLRQPILIIHIHNRFLVVTQLALF